MSRALFFLVSRSVANAVLHRLRRLKQPKYLAGAVFGALYFYFYFFQFLFRGTQSAGTGPVLPIGDLGVEIAALILFVVVLVFSWLWAGSRAALHFTEAEIAWLFPAPLDRPTLIRFKLLKSQLGLLFLSCVMTLISGRAALGSLALIHLVGWWIVFSTLQMHRLGASFARQRLLARGLSDWKRRLAVLVGVLALAAAVYFWKISTPAPPHAIADAARAEDFVTWLRSFLHAGPAPWLLLPFRLLVQPWFATDFSAFLAALPAALLLMTLHYIWVVRAHVSFEDASVALSQRRAAYLSARRSGDLRVTQAPRAANVPAFRLRATGFEPVAFIWKHLLAIGGRRTLLYCIGGSAILLAAAVAAPAFSQWPLFAVAVATIASAIFIWVTFTNAAVGARAVRQDLMSIDSLKTFPIAGWKIILGELLGPVFTGTALQIVSLAAAAASVSSIADLPPEFHRLPPMIFVCVAMLTPAINLTLMIIPTAATLLFPAWFKPGEAVSGGMETMGLRIIMALGQFLALGLALAPAAILGGVAWMSAHLLAATAWGPLAGTAIAALTLAVEAGMGVVWLGRLFDRFDPSES